MLTFAIIHQTLDEGFQAFVTLIATVTSGLPFTPSACMASLLIPLGTIVSSKPLRKMLRQLRTQDWESSLLAPLWLVMLLFSLGQLSSSPSDWRILTISLGLCAGWSVCAPHLGWLLAGWGGCATIASLTSALISPFTGLWLSAAISGLAVRLIAKRPLPLIPALPKPSAPVAPQPAQLMTDRLVRHLKTRLGLLTQSLPVGVIEADIAGRCRFLSPRAAEILRVTFLDGFIGTWFDHIVPSDRNDVADHWRECWERGETFTRECRILALDGGQRWIHVSGRPLISDLGTLYVATIDDITEQRRDARQLQKYTESLEKSHQIQKEKNRQFEEMVNALQQAQHEAEVNCRAMSEFLATISHEIRTPMTAILGFTDVLLEEAGDDLPPDTPLLTIRRNAEYLLDLLNDVLDLSKIESGQLDLELIRCSPGKIAQDVCELMQIRLRQRDVQLHMTVHEDVPETLICDPTRLKQILVNLVGNAIKFTHQGAITVELQRERQESMAADASLLPRLQISVTDTGIGMTDQQISRLFRPFCQGDSSTSRQYGGTGLGLTICKNFAQMLGGEISVISEPGSGSQFTVLLPIVDPQLAPSPELPVTKKPGVTQLPARTRLLLAEDGADNQRLITFILKKAGAEVEIARDGVEVVAQALAADAAGRPFDAILMDMQMPRMDGYQATQHLRAAGYSRPIIALTANSLRGDREKCLGAGCDEYAHKPIQRSQLLEAIQQLVLRRRTLELKTSADVENTALVPLAATP